MKSSRQHTFANVPDANIQRSTFDRSTKHKTTFDAGFLVPFFVDEALPGDTFRANLAVLARLSTPLKPIMDNVQLDVHFFAVPNRLVWQNWQKFCGERDDPVEDYESDLSYQIPQLNIGTGGFDELSMMDYMGIPPKIANISVSSLWFRAYNLIWNQFYRDENLQQHAPITLTDSGDSVTDFPLRRRGKRKDYFTSALPWPQKGPGVDIPLSGRAPIFGTGQPMAFVDTSDLTPGAHFGTMSQQNTLSDNIDNFMGLNQDAVDYVGVASAGGNTQIPSGLTVGVPTKDQANSIWSPGSYNGTGLYADLDETKSSTMTINLLRQAFQIQKLFERDARGGTRYVEIIRAHFNVVSPDFRLQRPEFLGGGTISLNVNPVQQTSASGGGGTPQGNLAGYAVAAKSNIGFTKSFVEHCLIIGLVSARADMTYSQGINRMFTRLTREDFYWPAFAHLGEQPVYNYEIFVQGMGDDLQVFGYQERHAEYRFKPSLITGSFRPGYSGGTLDFWHLSQVLDLTYPVAGDAPPVLNEDFIMENPPIDRVIAVPSEPHFIFDSYIDLKCTRPMPVYADPGYLDHF